MPETFNVGGPGGPTKMTAKVKPTKRTGTMSLTMNDSKVLGNYTKRLEKTMPPQQYQTRKFKTGNSNWTPIVHKPSNDQMFKERTDHVINWFDMWTDSQRKRFLAAIFRECKKSQLLFVQRWFHEHVPLRHLDFTRVLPRFLSLYILSFLDPRSLCRASMVSWNWKFVAEQDILWEPKCVKFGWYLPYSPADNEYGAWKLHYVACLKTLNVDITGKKPDPTYGGIGDGTDKMKRRQKMTDHERMVMLSSRPAWIPPDKNPQDLVRTSQAMLHDFNPNEPQIPLAETLLHDKFGTLKKNLTFYRNTAPPVGDVGLQATARRGKHRALDETDDEGLTRTGHRMVLSESLELETFEERRLMDLVDQPWEPPAPNKPAVPQRPHLSGSAIYPAPWAGQNGPSISKSYPNQAHPRIVFISSRIPAADVLVDAVNFGVVPIVYEYEGTSLESLMSQVDSCLQGRSAQSIGIFVHYENPGELRLVHGSTVDIDNLDTAEFIEFFQTIANFVLPPNKGGHIDLFAPLASCEPGTEMLVQLNILTGMQFTSPTGILGNYNHINSQWLASPETESPPVHYFCISKLGVWVNMADKVKEACSVTKEVVGRYFEQKHKDVISQLTGQILFDAMGQIDIQGANKVTDALVDGLVELGEQQNVKPLEFLGKYLLLKAGVKDFNTLLTSSTKKTMAKSGATLAPSATLSAKTLSAHLSLTEQFDDSLQNSEVTDEDTEVAGINGTEKDAKEHKNMFKYTEVKEKDSTEIAEEIEEDIAEEIEGEKNKLRKNSRVKVDPVVQYNLEDPEATLTSMYEEHLSNLESTGDSALMTVTRKPRGNNRRLTADTLADQPEKRTPIAKEILASEMDFLRTLDIIKNVYYTPLRNALNSNRAILSAQNVQVIFTDPLALMDLSKSLLVDLKSRLGAWDPQQCLGDVFVKFCTKLKAYTNFLNNYPVILTAIERSMEQAPLFRAFLKRHEKQADSKMLTLAELLLSPTRRIGEYVTLLTWFQMYTPTDHADRNDISSALKTLTQLNKLIQEYKTRGEKERELKSIQKKIINCPLLLEANRYFLTQLDVAHLKSPSDTVIPELRTYQHIEMLGFFLFNDSLVVTRRTTHNYPFEMSVEYQYRFETCTSLTRLRLEDMPNSKYIQNAFKMLTPKRTWICTAEEYEDKHRWMTLLDTAIRNHVNS